jgi:ATP-dependent RNA helicase DeaD
MTEFIEFNLKDATLKAIESIGYKQPTPIQAQAIPLIQKGVDLIALAQTGSGKTATCAIPLCDAVNIESNGIQGLVIVPTRELALQYATEAQKIGRNRGVKVFAMLGGECDDIQEQKLNNGVHILIATPGRLIDFIYSRRIDLSFVKTLVLDEADEMLSMGFYDDLEFIIQCINHEHQTLLFSATMPEKIRIIGKTHMRNPVEISLVQTNASPTNIQHQFLYCNHRERETRLKNLITDFQPKQSIIFCESRRQCEDLQKSLRNSLRDVDFLHGGLTQEVRTIITGKFRSGKIKHLVATDVAARGLDFTGVTHVFIYQLSDDIDTYLHRSGRTGRVDRKGVVTTLVTDRELQYLKSVLTKIKGTPTWIGDPPDFRRKRTSSPAKTVGKADASARPVKKKYPPRNYVKKTAKPS